MKRFLFLALVKVLLVPMFTVTAFAQRAVSCVDFKSGTVTGTVSFSEKTLGPRTYPMMAVTSGKEVFSGSILASKDFSTSLKLGSKAATLDEIKQYVAGKTVTIKFVMDVPNGNCSSKDGPGTYLEISISNSPAKTPGKVTTLKAERVPAPAKKPPEEKK